MYNQPEKFFQDQKLLSSWTYKQLSIIWDKVEEEKGLFS